jgi:hypothetical protein
MIQFFVKSVPNVTLLNKTILFTFAFLLLPCKIEPGKEAIILRISHPARHRGATVINPFAITFALSPVSLPPA